MAARIRKSQDHFSGLIMRILLLVVLPATGSLAHRLEMSTSGLDPINFSVEQSLAKAALHNDARDASRQNTPDVDQSPAFAHRMPGQQNQKDHYIGNDGRIDFISEAPLESIKAHSDELRGVLDRAGNFAFSVTMTSFEGFNSGLQRQHFQENYLEISRYPKASFEGRIIDNPDLTKQGTYPVRVRGQLSIHGVTRERILPGTIQVMPDKRLEIKAEFEVPLLEHNISIPKILHQKIAESIRVTIIARLTVPQ